MVSLHGTMRSYPDDQRCVVFTFVLNGSGEERFGSAGMRTYVLNMLDPLMLGRIKRNAKRTGVYTKEHKTTVT